MFFEEYRLHLDEAKREPRMGEAYIINIGIDKPTYLYVIYCKKNIQYIKLSTYLHVGKYIYIYITYMSSIVTLHDL
jgi:hypothetical protein